MKSILAEIKVLEQKIAETYESYKKRHPKTKKTPNDPLFQTTKKQKPVGDSAAADGSKSVSKKIKKKPLDHTLRDSWAKGVGMSAEDHNKASDYHHARAYDYERKLNKINKKLNELNRNGDPDYQARPLRQKMEQMLYRKDYHSDQDLYHRSMAKGNKQTAYNAKDDIIRSKNPYTGKSRPLSERLDPLRSDFSSWQG